MTATTTTGTASTTATTGDIETSSEGEGPSEGSGSTSGSASDTSVDSTGSQPDLGVCEQFIECAMEVMPETIATIIATYGPEGSCWSLPGVTEEDCWTECSAQLLNTAEGYPEAAACWACEQDADCPATASRCELFKHVCRAPDEIEHCDLRASRQLVL
ncbi:MAG TPA: hypothetical protein VG755_29695 [Nannocystaceae bacterium]|nr:hypothetical protein [Nannocystaceae bacterium]